MNNTYWIKKFNENGKIIWRKGREEGLEDAKGRIGDIANQINSLLKNKKQINVLEVGTGYGKALLEIKKLFGKKANTFGTNYEKEWNQKLTNEYAINKGFYLEQIPRIYCGIDASKKLFFEDNYFDFIFCQATMQYIEDKIFFIKEVNRLLTQEGLAVLELQEKRIEHPKEYENLIEIWENEKKTNVLDYLADYKNIKVKKSTGRDWHYIVILKSNKLEFNLKLIEVINLEKDFCNKWWGKKSIYTLTH